MGDVAIDDLKVLGSSLYANREVALYQGSLLVDPDLDRIARYLPHPSREPDYRRGRSHAEFLTSLVRPATAAPWRPCGRRWRRSWNGCSGRGLRGNSQGLTLSRVSRGGGGLPCSTA